MLVYASLVGTLLPEVVFPALQLLQGLFNPFLVIPDAIMAIATGSVSWKRIEAFLLAEEQAQHSDPSEADRVHRDDTVVFDDVAVECRNAAFTWDEQPEKAAGPELDPLPAATLAEPTAVFSLQDISIKIKRGQKVAIVGAVGSGKSSLFSGLVDEMTKTHGTVTINGTVGYCAQQPWILTETIQANILFNQPLDQTRLDRVVKVCGLEDDLQTFPSGILTEIGEKGVNLSGGQKARLALARALYFNPDIVLLDDPISALDAKVGRYVFENAIKGFLRDKTVLLVTHQLHLLPEMDHIIVMDKGRIVEQGQYAELSQIGTLLPKLMKDFVIEHDAAAPSQLEEAKKTFVPGRIIDAEEKEVGNVDMGVFLDFARKSGGVLVFVAAFLVSIMNGGLQLMSFLWISFWSSLKYPLTHNQYLLVYGLLGAVQFCTTITMMTLIYAAVYKSVQKYHPLALRSLLYAPQGFFDSQPVGRLLNRLSKDIESLDQMIGLMIYIFFIALSGCLANLVFLSYVDVRMLILVVPLVLVYFYMLKFYQRTNIELKRFESLHRSPLYAHISETMSGISTIKAFKSEREFVDKQRVLMDLSNSPTFLKQSGTTWIALRYSCLSASLTLMMCLLGVYGALDPSLLGVSLVYALGFAFLIELLLMAVSQLENEFNSVERLQHYCKNLPQETNALEPTDPSPQTWPSQGAIEFSDVSLSYPSQPAVLVLKHLSFAVRGGEKVGVIGRTGSGKSTLVTALFRLVEPATGSIRIDGRDIAALGLHTLRRAIQIIPQDPVLFSGTLRENLDVESLFADIDIWQVLDRIGMKEYVDSLPDKLEAPITENGQNLSVGQRQLICLGRAILCKPRILVMDEATASVDSEADKRIQESIKTYFENTTVLSIAHRLNTIADFDRVLVLQDGNLMEYDTPHALLSNPTSLYSQL
ncbi:hypothetical protein HDU91_004919, partial [Kappamyces sp. JEL0680]